MSHRQKSPRTPFNGFGKRFFPLLLQVPASDVLLHQTYMIWQCLMMKPLRIHHHRQKTEGPMGVLFGAD